MDQQSIDNILKQINDFKAACYDITLDAKQLKPVSQEEKQLLQFFISAGEQEKELLPNQSAESQFLTKIKVPVSFFHRCPTNLKQQILDYFNTDRDYLLRCYSKDEVQHCRAVLSPIFTRAYDNHKVFPTILDVLKDQDVNLKTFFNNDGVITRLEVLLSNETLFQGYTLTPGLMVTNSETGYSSLWIEPIVVVNNTWIVASRANIKKEYKHFRQIHKGEGIDAEQISETVRRALEAAQVGVIQYMENMAKEVKVEKAVDFAKSLDALPKRFVEILEEDWKLEENLKKEKAMRDILTAAADLPILAKISIEQQVGSWFGIFDNYMDRFDRLAEDMSLLQNS